MTVLFGDTAPIFIARGEPKDNQENIKYGEKIQWQPTRFPIYIGMRLTITRNQDKITGFVNGMGCVVRAVLKHGVEVVTDDGTPLSIHPKDDVETLHDGTTVRTTFLPIRVGYAINLHKVQGATLDHVTIWIDVPNVEAAGYVALSRVRHDADWRFVGWLSPQHFVPATNV